MKQLDPPGPSLRFDIRSVQVSLNWSLPFLGATIAYVPAKHAAGSPVANYLAAFLCTVAIVVLHELGHAVAARACSARVHAIVLSGYGGCCVTDAPRSLPQAALVAAGGLLAQLLLLVLTLGYLLVRGAPPSSPAANAALFVLVGANALYMLVNLAPIQGSDGALLLKIARQALAGRRAS